MTNYGNIDKKVFFSDTDKRHAELKVKLRRDGLTQIEFFKAMITGYIEDDPNIVLYMSRVKQEKGLVSKKKIKKVESEALESNSVLRELGITDEDIDFVFDLIEKGGTEE